MIEIDDDQFFTIQSHSHYEIKIKGSRFLAESHPVLSPPEALSMLAQIRKREYTATHHCYAYRTGLSDKATFKYSDDGEPSGTAGKPIYDIISGRNLTNLLVVVTRYFGGTKLGTGGLVRAYSHAAKNVIMNSKIITGYITESLKIRIEFSFYDQLVKLLNQHSALITGSDYSDLVDLEVNIRLSKTEKLMADIEKLSGGRARIEKISQEDG